MPGDSSSANGTSSTSAVPALGVTRPRIIRRVVVLPDPLGPRNPVTDPGSTVNVRSRTASTGPKLLLSPSTVIRPVGAFTPVASGAVSVLCTVGPPIVAVADPYSRSRFDGLRRGLVLRRTAQQDDGIRPPCRISGNGRAQPPEEESVTQTSSTVSNLLQRWAAERGDAEALRFGDLRLTWSELDERVRRLASALRAEGIGPGDRIAVLDLNHPSCVELTLACAQIGAANAVVNFRLAPPEIVYVINDAQARLLFVGPEFAGAAAQLRDKMPTVERVLHVGGRGRRVRGVARRARAGHRAPTTPRPDDCFVQLYTSGTTGFPKGAMLTHRGMLAHAAQRGGRLRARRPTTSSRSRCRCSTSAAPATRCCRDRRRARGSSCCACPTRPRVLDMLERRAASRTRSWCPR